MKKPWSRTVHTEGGEAFLKIEVHKERSEPIVIERRVNAIGGGTVHDAGSGLDLDPDAARELGKALIEAADASEHDAMIALLTKLLDGPRRQHLEGAEEKLARSLKKRGLTEEYVGTTPSQWQLSLDGNRWVRSMIEDDEGRRYRRRK